VDGDELFRLVMWPLAGLDDEGGEGVVVRVSHA
jgi:hypothetical protein